ncbi:MAG: hypothetical protein ACRCS8_03790 [Brevinema sp.]
MSEKFSINEDSLLYQELPSLEPRVSRRERISQQGPADCPDCNRKQMGKALRSSRFSYMIFLVLMVIFFGVMKFLEYTDDSKQWNSYDKEHRTFTFSKNQEISTSLINQENRYGMSLLFRNKNKKTWSMSRVTIMLNEELLHEIVSNISLTTDEIHTSFIKLPKEIDSLEKLDIVIE